MSKDVIYIQKGTYIMDTGIRKLVNEIAAEDLIELFAPSMDDYLYIMNLQKNTFRISQIAVDSFMMSGNSFDDAVNSFQLFVYKEDRSMIAEDLQHIIEGKEKDHNLYYRWLDKNGMPVWINCRGKVVDDKDGKPHYLIGCVNEIGNTPKADNISGLLGERELRSYISSYEKIGRLLNTYCCRYLIWKLRKPYKLKEKEISDKIIDGKHRQDG